MKNKLKNLIDWKEVFTDKKKRKFLISLSIIAILSLFFNWRVIFVVLFFGLFYLITVTDHLGEEPVDEEKEDVPEGVAQTEVEDLEYLELERKRLAREIRVTEQHVTENPTDLESKLFLEELKDELIAVEGDIKEIQGKIVD